VYPLKAKPKEMVRAEPTNNHTAGIDTKHSTTFTLLLDINLLCGEQRCSNCKIVPEEFLHLMAKYCTQYHLANL